MEAEGGRAGQVNPGASGLLSGDALPGSSPGALLVSGR
jgi:hypothetical protein